MAWSHKKILEVYGKIVARFKSKSDPSRKPYEVRFKEKSDRSCYLITSFACNCTGWARHRTCKHIKKVQTKMISKYLTSRKTKP